MRGKKYHAGRYAQRYQTYRRCFAAACFLYMIAYFVGAVLWSRLSLTSYGEALIQRMAEALGASEGSSFGADVLSVLLSRLVPLLALFLLGITLYAPLAWGGVMLGLGLFGGMGLGFLFRFASCGISLWLVITEIAFSLAWALVTAAYASFVLCVFFKQAGRIPDEDGKMFGGTLFCGSFYRGMTNLRFLGVYQIAFLCVCALQGVLALCYRLLLGWIKG